MTTPWNWRLGGQLASTRHPAFAERLAARSGAGRPAPADTEHVGTGPGHDGTGPADGQGGGTP